MTQVTVRKIDLPQVTENTFKKGQVSVKAIRDDTSNGKTIKHDTSK